MEEEQSLDCRFLHLDHHMLHMFTCWCFNQKLRVQVWFEIWLRRLLQNKSHHYSWRHRWRLEFLYLLHDSLQEIDWRHLRRYQQTWQPLQSLLLPSIQTTLTSRRITHSWLDVIINWPKLLHPRLSSLQRFQKYIWSNRRTSTGQIYLLIRSVYYAWKKYYLEMWSKSWW